MYNFAKLITEEPEKLERLIISFLKLLVTLYLGSIFIGFNISLSEFVEHPISKDYGISKLILFIIYLILIWFVLWNVLAEAIFTELLIFLLSKIGKKWRKEIVFELLVFFNVIKYDTGIVNPSKNILIFDDFLNTYDSESDQIIRKEKSRIRQYYLIAMVIYFVLLYAPDIALPIWLKWLYGFSIFSILIGNVVFHQFHSYFIDNLEEMKKQFGSLSYAQIVIKRLDTNSFIKENYERTGGWSRILLKRKSDDINLPRTVRISPVFYWNSTLMENSMTRFFSRLSDDRMPQSTKKGEERYQVYISNIEPNNEIAKNIRSLPGLAFLHCKNEEEIYTNIEVLFFEITNGRYKIDSIKSN